MAKKYTEEWLKQEIKRDTLHPSRQLKLFEDDLEEQSDNQLTAARVGVGVWLRANGIYTPWPLPDTLAARCEQYAINNTAAVVKVLEAARMDGQARQYILTDYQAAARGEVYPTAPPSVMGEAVAKIDPLKAYAADKYLFYKMVFHLYRECLRALNRYKEVRDGDRDLILYSLSAVGAGWPPDHANAWGLAYGFIQVEKLRELGVKVFDWEANTWLSGAWWVYYDFSHFAKYALQATAEELDGVPRPTGYVDDWAMKLYGMRDPWLEQIEEIINRAGELLAEGDAEDVPRILSRSLAEMGSGGPVFYKQAAAPSDAVGADLRLRLEEDLERGELPRPLYDTMMGVITGVNIMFSQGDFIEPGTGKQGQRGRHYEVHTTVSAFANACGYERPNGEQLDQLRAAMLYLHNIQFLCVAKKKKVWTAPILFQWGQEPANGAPRPLTIILPTEYVEGSNRIFTNKRQVLALQAARLGSEQRLNNIILTKEHKEEEALLCEVFDYDSRLAEAERKGTAAAFLKDWRSHKNRRREQLAGWFDSAKQRGLVKDWERTEKKGTGLEVETDPKKRRPGRPKPRGKW